MDSAPDPSRSAHRPRRHAGPALVVALAAFAVPALGAPGCDGGPAPESGPASPAPPVAPAASGGEHVDLSTVMRRAHFAFRRDEDGWKGRHTSYAVRADRGLHVIPRLPYAADGEQAAAAFDATVTGIARGGAAIGALGGPLHATPEGALEADRGAAVERIENGDDGVEQSFRFADRPGGRGDLVVRVAVSGEAYTGQSANGLHFADPATGLGVWYGRAVWTDARGAATPLALAYEGGSITVTVPAAVVDAAAYPATIDPTIGPELGMDNPLRVGATDTQNTPAAAFSASANATLVVWADDRDDTTGATEYADIYGARVTPTGAVLDPSGIPINTGKNNQLAPAVAFDGTEWIVVFTDDHVTLGSPNLTMARVSTAGVVLDPAGNPVDASGTDANPAIACAGAGTCLIAFQVGTTTAFVDVVTPAGGVQNHQQLGLGPQQYGPGLGVSFNAPNYLVAGWSNAKRPEAQRVSTAGAILDAAPITLGPGNSLFSTRVAVDTDGTNWMVAWNNAASVLVGRVSAAGASLDGTGVNVGAAGVVSNVALAFANGAYSVLWDNGNVLPPSTSAARVSVGAALIGTTAGLLPVAQPAVAFDGTNLLLAGTAHPGVTGMGVGPNENLYDIEASRVTATAAAPAALDSPPILVSGGANLQGAPAVAYNGTSFLAAWTDDRQGGPGAPLDIFGARFTTSGTVLDTGGIAISQAASSQLEPQIASNGVDWLVVWDDQRAGNGQDDVYGARVTAGGAVMDPSGIAVNTAAGVQQYPNVASDGTDYLVTFVDVAAGRVAGARVSSAGTVLDPTGLTVAAQGLTLFSRSSIAYNGTDYLVAWATTNGVADTVWGARVTPAGAVLDMPPLNIAAAGTSPFPSVTSDGSDWLVAWATAADATSDVRGGRVAANGTVRDPGGFVVSNAANAQLTPRAAYDGTSYWVAWDDQRAAAGHHDIYAARVSTAAVVQDVNGIAVATDPVLDATTPAIAAGPPGTLAIMYQKFDPAEPYGAIRVFARIASILAADGSPCATSGQCATGFCVQGVCCSSACTGPCTACTNADTGSPDGTCAPVKNGTDPRMSCPASGVPCATATCESGVCGDVVAAGSCLVGGACYAAGAANPLNACQTCQPPASQTMFTAVPNGTACTGNGLACETSTCQGGTCTETLNPNECLIGGVCYAAGTAEPGVDCRSCQPAMSTSAWSVSPDGTACTADSLTCTADECTAGVCTHPQNAGTCLIMGVCYASGALDPMDSCQQCVPATNPQGWTPIAGCMPDGGSGSTTTSTTTTSTTTTTTSSGMTTTATTGTGMGGSTTTATTGTGMGGSTTTATTGTGMGGSTTTTTATTGTGMGGGGTSGTTGTGMGGGGTSGTGTGGKGTTSTGTTGTTGTAGSGTTGEGGSGSGGGTPGAKPGCSCVVAGSRDESPGMAMAAFAFAIAVGARRRSRARRSQADAA